MLGLLSSVGDLRFTWGVDKRKSHIDNGLRVL